MVESEDPYTGHRQHICKAFFVFVAKPSDGGKVIDGYMQLYVQCTCVYVFVHVCMSITQRDIICIVIEY